MAYFYLAAGIVLLLLGGDWLVKGAVDLALRLKIDILVVGMTVVSFATSAPELLVSLSAALKGHTDISFGNVIGSNIANIALILGLTSIVFPMSVRPQTYRIDYWVMIFVTLVLGLFIYFDLLLVFWEGLVLVILLVVYNLYQIWTSRRIYRAPPPEVAEVAPKKRRPAWRMITYLLLGAVGLKYGSDLLINGSVTLAESWGVSERVIGITVVSVGTSLPELAASMVASFKGEQELSMGNLVGSNIFNVLAVLGITGLVIELPVKSVQLLSFDLPYFLIICLILYPFMRFIGRGSIGRLQGALMLALYAIYLYLVF